MKSRSIVKMQKDGKRHTHVNHKTRFNKSDNGVSPMAVRMLFQHYATLEAIFRILGHNECEGDLEITIRDGVCGVNGEIMTYHEVSYRKVADLVNELVFTGRCIATQFESGAVTATFSFSQTLEYKSE